MPCERSTDTTKQPTDVTQQRALPCKTDEDHARIAPQAPFIYLHRLLYALGWVSVLFVHSLAAHYHLKTSQLYSSLESSSLTNRIVAFDIVDASIGDHFNTLRGFHVVICVLHVVGAVMMLKNSLEDQTLAFYSEDFSKWALGRLNQTKNSVIFTQMIELALHTFFAYRLSHSVAISYCWSGVNVALLVFSCLFVSIEVVSRYRRHRFTTSIQQVTRVSFLVLHVLGVVVIPLVPLLEYKNYDMLGDRMQWLDDTWVVKFCDKMHTILYVSWADVFARAVLSLKLVYDLLLFKVTVRRRVGSGIVIQPMFRPVASSFAEIRARNPTDESRENTQDSSNSRCSRSEFNWRNKHVAATVILAVWGISIAAIHIKSQLLAAGGSPVCLSAKIPWVKSQTACHLVDINCATLQIDGQQTELDALWQEGFDPRSLHILVVRHCPRLEVPASFRGFSDLKILRIYNTTIASWPGEASIDSTFMSRLHTLNLVSVTFLGGVLPPGLLSPQIPSSLRFIAIIATNLASLPANLDSLWKPLGPQVSLAIELSDLAEVPVVIMRLNVGSISLAGNPIREIPSELFQLDQLKVISLGFTSIQALPVNVTTLGKALSVVSIINTAVEDIPPWFDAFLSADRVPPPNLNGKFRLKAGSTRWCHNLVANLRDRRVAAYAAKTDCGSMDMVGFPASFVAMKYGMSTQLGVGADPRPPA